MDNVTYTKLSALVDKQFTITNCGKYSFKKWDNEQNKMLISEKWAEGYAKKYQIDTDKGRLDLGTGQLSSLLEAVYYEGKADINGKTFSVKSNGKTGMDIRYYFSKANNTEGEQFNKFLKNKENLKSNIEVPEIDTDNPFPDTTIPDSDLEYPNHGKVTKEDEDFLRNIPF